jgi:hypothetical protein
MSGLGFAGLELGVIALVLGLLNARDRRRARAIAAVLGACPPALRGAVASTRGDRSCRATWCWGSICRTATTATSGRPFAVSPMRDRRP